MSSLLKISLPIKKLVSEFPLTSIVENIYSVYQDFSEEYLRQEYKPDISMYTHAIKNYDLEPDIFEKQDKLLTKKEQLQKELFMKAYKQIKE